jgi:hypothetical protein
MYSDMEKSLFAWFQQLRARNECIGSDMLLRKAKQIGREMKITDLGYSNSWLAGFKRRHLIVRDNVNGKATLVSRVSDVELNMGLDYVSKPRRKHSHYNDPSYIADKLNMVQKLIPECTVPASGSDGIGDGGNNIDNTISTRHVAQKCTTGDTGSNETTSNKEDLTLKDVQLCLMKVITFLKYHPVVKQKYIPTLLSLLEYFDTCLHSTRRNEQDQVDKDIIQIKQEDSYTILVSGTL